MSDQTFKQSMDLFHKTIAKYFPDRILELDILVAICASFFIRDISQPMALFLLGNPSSGKSTLLEIIKELPVILWRDNLTSAALLSATAFLFLERGTVSNKWKTSLTVAGLVTGIAFWHYIYM